MRWAHTIVTKADPELILPLDEIKRNLDVDFEDDDASIVAQRDAAIDWVEHHTNRFLGPTTIDVIVDELPTPFELPFAPVTAVSSMHVGESAYTGFRSLSGEPYRLLPPASTSWPIFTKELGAAKVVYEVGYAYGSCPAALTQAVKAIVDIFYDKPDRPEDHWAAVEGMLRSHRYRIL